MYSSTIDARTPHPPRGRTVNNTPHVRPNISASRRVRGAFEHPTARAGDWMDGAIDLDDVRGDLRGRRGIITHARV